MLNIRSNRTKLFAALALILVVVMIGAAACASQPAAPAASQPAAQQPAAQAQQPAAQAQPTVAQAQPAAKAQAPASNAPSGLTSDAAKVKSEFFNQQDLDRQVRLLSVKPEGPADKPWEQMLEPKMIDTAKFKKPGPYTLCFSNAGVNNPWRVVGYKTMQEEVKLHPEIKELVHVDAGGKDEKQIADIADLVASGKCDLLIVSPNTTAALTPAVEKACEKLPVVVFDRGVFTGCPVTFISPIGGYGFGYTGAKFISDKLPNGGNVLALRILPGVDVLETRWAAAKQVFEKNPNLKVVGVEFTDGDNAKVKSIVSDYLDKYKTIDAVWMDAGATSVAAIEAFEDRGAKLPIMNGEDQQDFLNKWQSAKMTAISPTYPTFQWRTPIIAAMHILKGEQVPQTWTLPQPTITQENLSQYVQPNMPPLHYAMCGCEKMPNYPAAWGGK